MADKTKPKKRNVKKVTWMKEYCKSSTVNMTLYDINEKLPGRFACHRLKLKRTFVLELGCVLH
jgi:hypothetical protein